MLIFLYLDGIIRHMLKIVLKFDNKEI